ncbi:hypothetical protein [Microbacterium sp.]
MPAPLAAETRRAVADDIRAGLGRNAIARKHCALPRLRQQDRPG